VAHVAEKKPKSIEEFLRITFKSVLDSIGALLHKLGIHPNTVTIIGLVGNFIGAYFLATGNILVGGILVLVMGPIDALDGALARIRKEPGKFGAFVDSVTDRYSELIILGGLLIYFLRLGDATSCAAVYLAAAGSVLVSYVKARAESLGFDAKVGILTRVERYIVLAPALVLQYPLVGVWIIAILANFTALQRIWFVRKQAYGLLNEPSKKETE
jgi:CDP-diacylglycerol--glycerol-3-phosphate 3-phosphatidyltransferase